MYYSVVEHQPSKDDSREHFLLVDFWASKADADAGNPAIGRESFIIGKPGPNRTRFLFNGLGHRLSSDGWCYDLTSVTQTANHTEDNHEWTVTRTNNQGRQAEVVTVSESPVWAVEPYVATADELKAEILAVVETRGLQIIAGARASADPRVGGDGTTSSISVKSLTREV